MPNLLVPIVAAVAWWSQRRKNYITIPEALKKFDIAPSREALTLMLEWWGLAERVYSDTLTTPRELTTKDVREVAELMGSLVYSFYGGEPSGKAKGPYAAVDKETDLLPKPA
jgi:hypothetical protein